MSTNNHSYAIKEQFQNVGRFQTIALLREKQQKKKNKHTPQQKRRIYLICSNTFQLLMIRGGSAPLKSLCVPVRFTCDLGTVRFQPNSFEWAEITPDRSKSSACTTFYGNHSNQIAWYFCTMQSGAGKCTVFATHVWSVISLTLTLAADRNCNAF